VRLEEPTTHRRVKQDIEASNRVFELAVPACSPRNRPAEEHPLTMRGPRAPALYLADDRQDAAHGMLSAMCKILARRRHRDGGKDLWKNGQSITSTSV
jgi:hypothetical protein